MHPRIGCYRGRRTCENYRYQQAKQIQKKNAVINSYESYPILKNGVLSQEAYTNVLFEAADPSVKVVSRKA